MMKTTASAMAARLGDDGFFDPIEERPRPSVAQVWFGSLQPRTQLWRRHLKLG